MEHPNYILRVYRVTYSDKGEVSYLSSPRLEYKAKSLDDAKSVAKRLLHTAGYRVHSISYTSRTELVSYVEG